LNSSSSVLFKLFKSFFYPPTSISPFQPITQTSPQSLVDRGSLHRIAVLHRD
jgi:hypothetical protein